MSAKAFRTSQPEHIAPKNLSLLSQSGYTQKIKNEALRLGFMNCGIARAGRLDDDARRLEQWLNKGFQAGMQYMEKHFDLRIDPTKLVPGARSVITLLLNYYPREEQAAGVPRIAKYAWGEDYHIVIREKLNALLHFINTEIGQVQGRGFVDSAPVLERSWAVKSGLGWVGKNGNLLSKKSGSFFFIATLITDLDLDPDQPFTTDHCGSCTRCLDACPTGALVSPTVVDSRKCISYLTIELKDATIPSAFEHQMEGWIFGCDICQDVCPWNRFATTHSEEAFSPVPELLNLSTGDWEAMTEEGFRKYFGKSALKRAKYQGLMRNLRFLRKL